MKSMQLNKRYVFLIFLLFCIKSSLAQNPLDLSSTEPAEIKMPVLAGLDVQWWQYFESTKTNEEFNARQKSFITAITKVLEEQSDESLSEKNISVIKELLNQYNKQKFIVQNTSETQVLTLQDSYSIQELIELNAEKNEIIILLNENKNEIINISDKITTSRNQIDQFKVDYFTQTSQLSKYKIGLQWIDQRIRQALDELRLTRLNKKSEHLEKNIQLKVDLIAKASERLVLNKSQPSPGESENIKEQQAKVQSKIDELNLKLAQDFAHTNDAKLDYEINQLDLTLAQIENTKYDLLLNKNTQIIFLEQYLNNDAVDIEILRRLINDSESLLNQVDDLLDDWQKTSQGTLLQPALNLSEKPSKNVIKLDQNKRKKAQVITTNSGNIRALKNDNLFNLNLLKIKLSEVETGISKIWNNIKSFSKGTVGMIEDLIYNPLFTINEYPVTLLPLIKLLLIILIGYLLSKFVSYLIKRYEKKYKIGKTTNRSSLYLVHRLAHYFIFFIVTVTGLSTLGINLGNITLIAGALSVGIGFGLQNLVSNFVSGLTIMFEKTLSVGDYIELDDGTTGVIKEIRARSTRLNTNDNIDVIIPNSDMVTNKIVNWTLKESIRRVKIPFGVAYGTDKELVKKAAIEAASNVEYALTNMSGKEPEVWLTDFGDSSVNFILLVWVAHYGLRRPNRIRSYFLWELDTALNKYNIEIPFPQRDVHLNVVKPNEVAELDDVLNQPE